MIEFTTLKNRCAIIKTPRANIFLYKNPEGTLWWCDSGSLAYALGYGNLSQIRTFHKTCNRLGACATSFDGKSRIRLDDVIEYVLPNIADALTEKYKSPKSMFNAGIELCEIEHNARIIREMLLQFFINERHEEDETSSEENEIRGNWLREGWHQYEHSDFAWEDFESLATWMAEEISYPYIMSKKSYGHQLPQVPFRFYWRAPIGLGHEERTLVALFIRRLFREYWETGKTGDFDSHEILRSLTLNLGLKGYENSRDLSTICWAFAKKFPYFIQLIEGGDL